jgi:hypothetical protein
VIRPKNFAIKSGLLKTKPLADISAIVINDLKSSNNSGSTSATTKVPMQRSQTVNSGFASRNGSQKPGTRMGD